MDFSCTCPRREARLHFDKIFAVDSEEARRGTAVNESVVGGTVVTLLETRPRNSIALFLVYENETTSPRISRNSFQTIFLHARKLEAGSGLTVNIPRYAFYENTSHRGKQHCFLRSDTRIRRKEFFLVAEL